MLFLAAFAGIFGYFLAQGVQQTSVTLEERSAAAARVVATNASWISEVAYQTLSRVDNALGPTMHGQIDDLQLALEGLPPSTEVYIVDSRTDTIFSTVPGASEVSIADREYFTAVRDGAPFYLSSLIESRLTGDSIFVFSKRVEREGEFAGAVMVSFPAAVLESIWESLDLPEGSTISLVKTDGMLIARYPPVDGAMDLSNHVLFTQYFARATSGHYVSEASPVDGIARVVSYRLVEGTDIIALASISSQGTWAGFRSAILAVFLIASPIILGLAVGSVWIVRLLYRDQARQKALEAADEANKLLFREIHHRVKNNLQSVQSLLSMQEMPETAKRDLRSRLAAMSAMHSHIYQFDKFNDIDAHEYVPAVVGEVMLAYGARARAVYDVDRILVDRDHATPLALLLSELATNALKYAFPDVKNPELRVTMKPAENGRVTLVVEDNGVGFDASAVRQGMGTRLIKGVVGQMDGTYSLSSENGTRFEADIAVQQEARRLG